VKVSTINASNSNMQQSILICLGHLGWHYINRNDPICVASPKVARQVKPLVVVAGIIVNKCHQCKWSSSLAQCLFKITNQLTSSQPRSKLTSYFKTIIRWTNASGSVFKGTSALGSPWTDWWANVSCSILLFVRSSSPTLTLLLSWWGNVLKLFLASAL
jgi:hypothetical protein